MATINRESTTDAPPPLPKPDEKKDKED